MLHKVNRNTALQMGSRLLAMFVSLLLVTLLTRHLGEAGYGMFATAVAWAGVLIACSDLGLFMVGVQELAKESEEGPGRERIYAALLLLKTASGLAVVAAGLLGLLLTNYPPALQAAIAVVMVYVLANSLLGAGRSVLQADMAMGKAVAGEVCGNLVMLLATLGALALGWGLLGAVAALAAGSVVQLGLVLFFAARHARLGLRGLDAALLKSLFWRALPLGIAGVLAIVHARLDTLLLSWMKPMGDVGIYWAAYRVLDMVTMLPALYMANMLPLFTKSLNAPETMQTLYDRAFETLACLAVPLLCGGLFLAGPIMELIAGAEFAAPKTFMLPLLGATSLPPAETVLAVLLLMTPLVFLGQLNGGLLVACSLQRQLLWLYCFITPLNAALSLALIPGYTYLGAAAATVLSEIVALACTMRMVGRILSRRPPLASLWRALLASAVMLAALWLLEVHVLLRVAAGALVYGGALHLLLGPGGLKRLLKG